MTQRSSQFPVLSSQKNRAFRRWLKFNAVGGIGIGVQLTALAIFRSLRHSAFGYDWRRRFDEGNVSRRKTGSAAELGKPGATTRVMRA